MYPLGAGSMLRDVRALLAFALLGALAGCGGADGADRPTGPLEVVDRLRDGGYVVYLRHAATDHSQKDRLGVPLTDCRGQRNLNDAGRAQARSIGESWRALELPLGDVRSSGYCRTRQTAELAFGEATIVPTLTGIPAEMVAATEVEIEEGDAAVFEPLGDSRYRLLAKLPASAWPQLVEP